MKRLPIMVMSLVLAICLSGCAITIKLKLNDVDDADQTITFVNAKFYGYFDDSDGVALFFDYTNDSGESRCVADGFIVGAFQNEKQLAILSVGEEEIDGAKTMGISVETGTTVRVVYLFVLRDTSPLSVMISDGQEFTIDYEQIGEISNN